MNECRPILADENELVDLAVDFQLSRLADLLQRTIDELRSISDCMTAPPEGLVCVILDWLAAEKRIWPGTDWVSAKAEWRQMLQQRLEDADWRILLFVNQPSASRILAKLDKLGISGPSAAVVCASYGIDNEFTTSDALSAFQFLRCALELTRSRHDQWLLITSEKGE